MAIGRDHLSFSAQILETSLFEIRSPSDSTTWSTFLVETPAT